jgi:hypothetical protein
MKFETLKKYSILFLLLFLIPSTFLLRQLYYYGAICGFPYSNVLFDVSGCGIEKYKEEHPIEKRIEEVGTEQSVLKMGFMNYLNFAYGNVWFIVLAFCSGATIFFFGRNKINVFVLIMLLVFLLVFFTSTSRAEDTARYTLAWVPVIAMIAGKYFEELYNFIKKYQKYLALVVFVLVIIFSYQNLIEKLNIMKQVKQFSPLFFEACDWIKENTDESALISTIWSARAVYSCQRNATGVFSDLRRTEDPEQTVKLAKELGITHFFIQKFSLSNEIMIEKYSIDFVQFLENNPEYFKKVYENGPPLQQCIQQGGCDGNIVYEIVY